ncbi:MAG: hypothetical protein M3N25_07630, partial [Actinomycetota bacterium]|nr:hypothetical protein [Actinomycetota bacterium]
MRVSHWGALPGAATSLEERERFDSLVWPGRRPSPGQVGRRRTRGDGRPRRSRTRILVAVVAALWLAAVGVQVALAAADARSGRAAAEEAPWSV